jgi:hypothetical protein
VGELPSCMDTTSWDGNATTTWAPSGVSYRWAKGLRIAHAPGQFVTGQTHLTAIGGMGEVSREGSIVTWT